MKNLYKQISTLSFVGYLPAPGTWGSIVGLMCVLLLNYLGISCLGYTLILLLLFFLSLFFIKRAEPFFNAHDPNQIVLDEFVGVFVAFYLVETSYFAIAFIFLVFRFFDIVKPLGLKILEKKIPGALGILLDDVLAGIYALTCYKLVVLFLKK